MKFLYAICVIISILEASSAATQLPEICEPRDSNCTGGVGGCSCSSQDVEFLSNPERICTAPPAIYEIKFVYCNPNFNWSRPFAATHNSQLQLWDACMANVKNGISYFSMTGDPGPIIGELTQLVIEKELALDIPVFDGDSVVGSGSTAINLTLDKKRQYVSTITRLQSDLGKVAGVTDLRLCDGDKWKKSVTVCLNELFSTINGNNSNRNTVDYGNNGTNSSGNTVNYGNCSLGHVEFTLQETEDLTKKRTDIKAVCGPKVPEECPGENSNCPTCCCKSSKNVEFYNPEKDEPECSAADPASYEVIFNFTWSRTCHPDNYMSFSVFNPVWSWPVAVSHNTEYRMWDACMDDVSIGVGLISQIGLPFVLKEEFEAAGTSILNHTIGPLGLLPNSTSVVFQQLVVDKDHQWVSAISNRGPTHDQIVGVTDLGLCDGKEWKKTVKVCFELFSTAVVADRVAPAMERNSVQYKNCSFGYIEFKLSTEIESSATPTLGINTLLMIAALFMGAVVKF